ncbi:MAG TPA: alcohol dehydrogenase catalytic domain-containing protein [Burkholderiales bacterium]|jgi:alcohol dehydrogenase|nr:alcohol dehydrogenase catalytic domain-containing protein [Burkholderiales bacterium]
MKALVYTAPDEVTYRDEPDPVLAEGEVVLKIDAVGICGSDMHAYHGHDPRRVPPLVLGHEFAGTIVAGPGTGRRTTGNPLIACGTCEFCVQGRSNLCANRSMVGMTRAGAFAEHMSIPASALVDIPQDMTPVKAALAEPAATALHALHLVMRAAVRPLPECAVLVIGGGAIGMLAALLARRYGVRRLTLAETNPLRRASVDRAVGCATYDPRGEGAPRDGSVDVVVDAVGSKGTRAAAFAAVKPGGVVMHIGLQDWASEIDMRKLTLAEITLIGTYTYTTADLRATVAALYDGVFGDLAWVEERPLAAGAAAFRDLAAGRSAAAKIVLRP